MIESIISNNCTGGAVMHELGMEFKTPTINLQILPEQYPRFCKYLKYYLAINMRECTEISDKHEKYLIKMFGGVPDMPLGILDDVVVCFQHYPTFEEGKSKWDERKAKINYDHIGYIFHVRGPEYKNEAEAFLRLPLDNKLLLTQDFSVEGSIGFEGEGFSTVNDKLLITQIYDYKTWREDG